LIAAALSMAASRLPGLRKLQTDCACLVVPAGVTQPAFGGAGVQHRSMLPELVVASATDCAPLNTPLRVSPARVLERLHILSAMSICFARGVNDTPKLTALLLAANLFGARASCVWIAIAMGIGGVMFATQVARTMSQRMTRIGHSDGLAANMITAVLVLFASKFGLPVSTTHVAVGAIAGVGAGTGSLNWQTLRSILLSWVATLPLAAAVAFAIARLGT
jgi:PiT family inorganic phosphate transporter